MERFISEECYNDIVEMAAQMVAEEFISEYIKQGKMNQLSNVHIKRRVNVKNAPEGPEKEAAQKKLDRNIELTNNKIERSGSSLQKAVNRGYSKNAAEKKALLNAGYAIKEDPIEKGRHNIAKY